MKGKLPHKLQAWVEARRRYRLSHAQVQMARELGLNPGKLGKLANDKQEPWKLPLPAFIESLYFKRFGKPAPDEVLSIEEQAKLIAQEKEERRQEKAARRRQGNAEAAEAARDSALDDVPF